MMDRRDALRAVQREAALLPEKFGGCVMCGLVEHTKETHLLSKTRGAVAVLARFGVRRGHVLVVLRRHTERWEDLSRADWLDAQGLAWEAARAIETALGASRVYVASLGSAKQRAMTFPHHHLHVVPTYHGDRRDRPATVFTWERGVVVPSDREVQRLRDAIRGSWLKAS
jgi:diadenosine tetraphosphate (Ap4A) HIT family hydrolase